MERSTPEAISARVYGLNDTHGDPILRGWDAPGTPPYDPATSTRGERDCDLAEWGLMYGIAFGIARAEDPFESVADCADRAREAAILVWNRWNARPGLAEAS